MAAIAEDDSIGKCVIKRNYRIESVKDNVYRLCDGNDVCKYKMTLYDPKEKDAWLDGKKGPYIDIFTCGVNYLAVVQSVVVGELVPDVTVEIPTGVKPLGAKSIDMLCDHLGEITSGKELGSGKYGTVYKSCLIVNKGTDSSYPCAIKVQGWGLDQRECSSADFYDLQKEIKVTNKLHKAGLAPKIYAVRRCPGNVCLVVMDLVQGTTLEKIMLESDKLTPAQRQFIVGVFFRDLDKMHSVLEHGHGDPGPRNIMYDKEADKFIFIDISSEDEHRPAWFDYLVMLYYLNAYVRIPESSKISILMVNEILRRLEKIEAPVSLFFPWTTFTDGGYTFEQVRNFKGTELGAALVKFATKVLDGGPGKNSEFEPFFGFLPV